MSDVESGTCRKCGSAVYRKEKGADGEEVWLCDICQTSTGTSNLSVEFDTCVSCGEYINKGRQVCIKCETDMSYWRLDPRMKFGRL